MNFMRSYKREPESLVVACLEPSEAPLHALTQLFSNVADEYHVRSASTVRRMGDDHFRPFSFILRDGEEDVGRRWERSAGE